MWDPHALSPIPEHNCDDIKYFGRTSHCDVTHSPQCLMALTVNLMKTFNESILILRPKSNFCL